MTIKKVAMGLVSTFAFAFTSIASAVTITPVAGGPYTFNSVGTVSLTQFGIPTSCTMSVTGFVNIVGANIEVDVTSGSVAGGGLCGSVNLNLTTNPWKAVVPIAGLPTNPLSPYGVTFTNVKVRGPLGDCTTNPTTAAATYSNGATSVSDPSSFTFTGVNLGVCSITNGVVSTAGAVDVNIIP